MKFYISDELIIDSTFVLEYQSETGIGNVDIYIDGEIFYTLDIWSGCSGSLTKGLPDLTLGKHTCNMVYEGNDRYNAFNKTCEFDLVHVSIRLYETMSDTAYIKVITATPNSGIVTITANGSSQKFNMDRSYYFRYPVSDIGYGKYDIEVTYSGDYGNVTKRKNVTIDYNLNLYEYSDE